MAVSNSPGDRPDSPSSALSRWIEEKKLSQKEAARELQWKEPELSMILSNRRPISERMAHDLVRTLGDMPEYRGWEADDWIELQRRFTEWKKASEAAAESRVVKTNRVGVLCDEDICELCQSGPLKIEPFNESFVQPASYDLTAGTLTWFNPADPTARKRVKLEEAKRTSIAPGETVYVVARETLVIPVNMIARLAAVGYLVELGILCSFGLQLEPGWSGQPFFTLSHHGDSEIEIGFEDPCVSVEFQFLQRTPKHPFGKAPRHRI